jgi:uncharacterized membrane protein SpoIIM required for sporulation
MKAPGAIRTRGLDVEGFIKERQNRWRKLEELLERWHREPGDWLDREVMVEFVRLYRLACSDLNQARTYTANPDLLGRLNQLVGRAYRIIYQAQPKAPTLRGIGRFFTTDAPAAFQREVRAVLLSACVLLLGAVVGFAAVLKDPANAEALLPAQFFSSSPAERVEKIEEEKERIGTAEEAAGFSAMLFSNNIRVAILAFSLGALTVVGGLMIAFYNGALLGAVAAGYFVDDVWTFFVAWVGPHGAFELPAIVFATAAGVRAGEAFFFPGDTSRGASLRAAFPSVSRILVTTALMLFAAGLIEGSFSQFSSKSIPYPLKIAVAVGLFSAMCYWLYRPSFGRGGPADG